MQGDGLQAGRPPVRIPGSEALVSFAACLSLALIKYRAAFLEDAVLAAGDAFHQNYPLAVFYSRHLKDLTLPLWNPYVFLGLPYLGSTQTGALYPLNLALYFALSPEAAFNLGIVLHYALAGWFTYLYARAIGAGRMAALSAGAAFELLGFMPAFVAHPATLHAAAWLPLALFALERLRCTPSLRHSALLALPLAMQMLAANFQVALYTLIALGVVAAFHAAAHGRQHGGRAAGRFVMLIALAVAFACLIAAPQIAATAELSRISLRGVAAETLGEVFRGEYRLHAPTLPSLVAPGLFPSLVGDDATLAYAGLLPLVLGVAACAWGLRRSVHARALGALALIALVLAMAGDTPLGRLFARLPLYGDLRAHGRHTLEFSLAVSVLFALGLDGVLQRRGSRGRGPAAVAALAALGLGLALAWASGPGAEAASRAFADMAPKGWPATDPSRMAALLTASNPAVAIPLVFLIAYAALLGLLAIRPRPAYGAALVLVFALEAAATGAFGAPRFPTRAVIEAEGMRPELLGAIAGRAPDGPFRMYEVSDSYASLYHADWGVGSLSSYDQMMPLALGRALDMEPLGFSRYADHLILNNLALSLMNVGYVAVPKGSYAHEFIGRAASAPEGRGRLMREEAASDDAAYALPPEGRPGLTTFSMDFKQEGQSYLISLRARALGQAGASLRMEVFPHGRAVERTQRERLVPLYVYPGAIGPEETEYYRFSHEPSPGPVSLKLEALTGRPLEFSSVEVTPLREYLPPALAPGARRGLYTKLFETASHAVYRNENAIARVFTPTVLRAGDPAMLKRELDFFAMEPGREAIVRPEDAARIGSLEFTPGEARVAEYGIHRVRVECGFPGRGFLVLSDQHYPGWTATVDGRDADVFEVDGLFRGVVVPPGSHEVVFEYVPRSTYILIALGGASLLAAIALALLSDGRCRGLTEKLSALDMKKS